MRYSPRLLALNVLLKMYLVSGAVTPPPDLHFLRNGMMTLEGWKEAATYYAIEYKPVCGMMQTGLTKSIDQIDCKTAMSYFKSSSKTYATYDDLGVESSKYKPGDGNKFCLCFSLKDTSGKMGDFCISVTADGEQNNGWTFSNDRRANGQFSPASNKALPACPDVDLAAISASIAATTASATSTASKSTSTQVTDSGDVDVSADTAPGTDSSSNGSGTSGASDTTTGDKAAATTRVTSSNSTAPATGLSLSDKIALGVGLGGGIPGLILSYLMWRLAVRSRADAKAEAKLG